VTVRSGPADELAPAGMRLCRDAGARLLAGGTVAAGGAVLVGGSPVRVLRLTPSGARHVSGWWSGTPVPGNEKARALARRLLDTGIAHPVPDRSTWGPADVTVVIPVRDRQAELARCLHGLSGRAWARRRRRPDQQGPPGQALGRMPRVIVVDDGSSDPAAIARVASGTGAHVVHRAVNGGPGAARNTGLAAADTPLVAFLDSDCVPGPGWLDLLLPHFADPAVGAVAPRIVPAEAGDTWLARYEGASSTLDMGARASIVRPGSRVPYVPGAALVVRRAAAGAGFDATMRVGEDVDFVWRLTASGWRVRYEPAATMRHQHRVRLGAWFARRKDYGTSAALLELRHPGTVRPLYVSPWTALAWVAAAAGRPAAAAALTGAGIALLARRLAQVTGDERPRKAAWPPPGQVLPGRTAWALPGRTAWPPSGWVLPGRTAWALAVRLAGGGTLAAGRPLGSAVSRTWWPVALPAAMAVRRLRAPLAALVLTPPLLDWLDRRPPLDPARYVAARLLDDVAYSLGVWQGCAERRTVRPLLPRLGHRHLDTPHVKSAGTMTSSGDRS
jgi:mycofactocin glycosyltransferase